MSDHNEANVSRFDGFAEIYDQHRPQPPKVLPVMLTQWLGTVTKLVVDIGCGTGLSTRIWQGQAERVIGIEPNDDMRSVAEQLTPPGTCITYQYGTSTQTGLPDESADIVCISQAFHWMEPVATLNEVSRVLRPGGILAVIDCDWPPMMNWQAEQKYREMMELANLLEAKQKKLKDVKKWPKSEHMHNIEQCGHFRYTREITLHNTEAGNADRLIGLLYSQGGAESLMKLGVRQFEDEIDPFKEAIHEILGETLQPWYVSYRVRLGVK